MHTESAIEISILILMIRSLVNLKLIFLSKEIYGGELPHLYCNYLMLSIKYTRNSNTKCILKRYKISLKINLRFNFKLLKCPNLKRREVDRRAIKILLKERLPRTHAKSADERSDDAIETY